MNESYKARAVYNTINGHDFRIFGKTTADVLQFCKQIDKCFDNLIFYGITISNHDKLPRVKTGLQYKYTLPDNRSCNSTLIIR